MQGARICLLVVMVTLVGCATAADHARSLHSAEDRRLTVGTVQREIRNGMTGAEVAEALGSPNIVTKDSSDNETWIYDKIASEASYSNSTGGAGGLAGAAGAAGSVLLLGLISGDYRENTGASASTQRTLTVVIKFDRRQRVSSATYHASQF